MKSFWSHAMSRRNLWRTLTIVFVILTAFVYTLYGIAETYAPVINKELGIVTGDTSGTINTEETYRYKSDYADLTQLYQAKVGLIRSIAAEGTVLLKNDNDTLPLNTNGKVVLLGEDGFCYDTTNAGGMMKISKSLATSLSGALRYNGYDVSISISDASSGDTVIVIVGRAGGETKDLERGSLALTDEEKSNITVAKASGAKVVLLLSGDFAVEIDDYKKDNGIGAIVKFGNAGFRGAYGLADVLAGNTSPSGKLVDTFAANSLSSPAMSNFGSYQFQGTIKASLAQNYVVYLEGIYTDYKYYETRYEDTVLGSGNASSDSGATVGNKWEYDNEVTYPFGYGLSYTDFAKEIVGEPVYDAESDAWTISVKVTNIGKVSGKEVVQVYAQTPYTRYDIDNKVEKSAVMLAGYAKTNLLTPDDSQVVTVKVHQQWLASYDYTNAKGYIMDAGNYYLTVGDDAHCAVNNILAAKGYDVDGKMELVRQIVPDIDATESAPDTQIYKHVYNDVAVTNAFDDADINHFIGGKVVYLTRNDWQGTYPQTVDSLTPSAEMKSILQDKKKYENGTVDTRQRVTADNDLKYGLVNSSMLKVIDMTGKSYDHPDWQTLLNKLSIEEMSNLISDARYTICAVTSVVLPEAHGNDNPTGLWEKYKYRSIDKTTGQTTPVSDGMVLTDGITDERIPVDSLLASMYCSEPVLAATFNDELAACQGDMFAEDALYCGMNFIWGMGVNMHRTPYGGRASEYFSADPILSALMGAAWNKAATAKGCVLVVKHFVANEQETNRNGVCTFINEQTLRESYLRAFEGVAVYGDMRGVMTSYNRLGLICTASEYDLMTQVLRNEWGFVGYAITDLYSPTAGCYDGNAMVAAGTDAMLSNSSFATGSDYVTKTLSAENIAADPTLLTAVRESCHRMLYTFANSNLMNGISSDTEVVNVTPFYIPLIVSLQVVFTVVAVAAAAMYVVSSVKSLRDKGDDNE